MREAGKRSRWGYRLWLAPLAPHRTRPIIYKPLQPTAILFIAKLAADGPCGSSSSRLRGSARNLKMVTSSACVYLKLGLHRTQVPRCLRISRGCTVAGSNDSAVTCFACHSCAVLVGLLTALSRATANVVDALSPACCRVLKMCVCMIHMYV